MAESQDPVSVAVEEFVEVRVGQTNLPDENPWVLEDVDCEVNEGMVMIAHPNTYLPLSGYMTFGDTLLVTRNGCLSLNQTEKKLFSKV